MADNDTHPMDEPLGKLHECVWMLRLRANHTLEPQTASVLDWAAQQIAEAHEAIQNYIIAKEM